jgi:hypothetical protein
MTYLALLFSPEVQSLSFANVQLPALSMTNDSVVKVSLTLGNNLVLASDEMLQVSANGTDCKVSPVAKIRLLAKDKVTLI